MPIPEKEPSPFRIYKGNSLLGIVTAEVSIHINTEHIFSQQAIPQGRRSFKTINMKLNKPENLCSKIDFRKADAHLRQ